MKLHTLHQYHLQWDKIQEADKRLYNRLSVLEIRYGNKKHNEQTQNS